MSARKRRLGRGLDALLGDAPASNQEETDAPGADRLSQLPVESLQRGQYQPRSHMDEEALSTLAQSIKARGVVQPIIARRLADGGHEIIAGERRWRAAQLAGLHSVPVIVREIPDDAALAIALIENIQRENLNPIEEANGLRRLLDEFGMTHEQVAESVGRSRSSVTNLLRLLSLNPAVKQMVEHGQLEMGHARALLALEGADQDKAAREVVARQFSARQAESLVRRIKDRPKRGARGRPPPDADVLRLQEQISDRLGAKVTITDKRGKGRLVIEYHSLDELDGILERIH